MGVEIALAVASIAATAYSAKQQSKSAKKNNQVPTALPDEVTKNDELTVQANISKEQALRRSRLKSIRSDSIKTSPLGLVDAPGTTETTLLGG